MGRVHLPREHGTDRGYRQHYKLGEPPCEPCMQAMRDRSRARRQSPAGAADRAYTRARGRALERLKDLYPLDFEVLMGRELARIEEESA